MAQSTHPITGVPLNDITYKRKRLSQNDAVTAHIMRMQGEPFTDIVQKLGTNANRVGEVLRGDAWPEAHQIAIDKLGGDLFSAR